MKLFSVASSFMAVFALSLNSYASDIATQKNFNSTLAPVKVTSMTELQKIDDHSSKFTYLGLPVTLSESKLNINKKVPSIGLVDSNLKSFTLGGAQAKPQVIASLVSLSTPVCSKEAQDLEKLSLKNPDVNFIVVSKDLPFLFPFFVKEHNIKNVKFVSSFRNNNFGSLYGTLVQNGVLQGLDSRAIFVINKNGNLIYQQRVSEIATPPNYKTLGLAINSLKSKNLE